MNYYLANTWEGGFLGIACEPDEQRLAFAAMHDATGKPRHHWREVTESEFENTVIDLRFEDGEISQ